MRLKFLVIATILAILPSCYTMADPPDFKVGINLPLSGDVAEYGIAAKNGIEMAREEHPRDFEKITFVYEDNKYDGKTAVAAFHKQKDSDKVALSLVWGDTRNVWNLVPGNNPAWLTLLFSKIVGLIVTTIAVMQGAPFWFDLLRRATGKCLSVVE